jgi:hypothetical protein
MNTKLLQTGGGAAVATLLVTLCACGSSGGGGSGTTGTTASASDKQEAALKWAQCMREHGVDMPDPEVDDKGRMKVQMRGGPGANVDAAQKACGDLQQKIGPANLTPEERQQAEQAMLEFAQCMRAHGQDVPDPTPGEGIKLRRPRDDPGFEAAQEACQDKLPGMAGGGDDQ